MLDWLNGLAGPEYARAILWTLGALVLLVIVLVIVRLVRGMTFGTFVAGGRNRKTRLAVMDATAVDSHRRLVLVRRDDIEHLLLIGGPTDLVVERDIRLSHQRRPELTGDTPRHAPVQAHPASPQQQRPRPPEAAPARAPAQPRVAEAPRPQQAPPPRPEQPKAEPAAPMRVEPPVQRQPQLPPLRYEPPRQPPRIVPPAPRDEMDDELLKELEVSLDETKPRNAARPPVSLDDEMTKLLGELSSHKR